MTPADPFKIIPPLRPLPEVARHQSQQPTTSATQIHASKTEHKQAANHSPLESPTRQRQALNAVISQRYHQQGRQLLWPPVTTPPIGGTQTSLPSQATEQGTMVTETETVKLSSSHPVLSSQASRPTGDLHGLASTAGAGAQLGHRRMKKISIDELVDMQWAKESQPLRTRKSVSGSS